MGKTVLIPTMNRPLQDDQSVISGFTVITMKGVKRRSLDAARCRDDGGKNGRDGVSDGLGRSSKVSKEEK